MPTRKARLLAFVIICVVILAFSLPIAAMAYFASIDTDDAAIDPDWAGITVFYTSPGNNPGIADQYEVKQAWVTREADNSFWYFRAVLYGRLPLDNLSSIEARISCNNDTVFTSSEDKVILYYHADPHTNDNVMECEGDTYPSCSGAETQGSDFGEEIPVGDGTYSYEWKADISDPGGVDWSTCTGNEVIQFAVANDSFTTIDSTTPRNFDVPTAIELVGFGTTTSLPLSLQIATLLALIFAGSLAVIWRFRNR